MKRIKERLEALEQGSTSEQQRITCIELVDAETGEVGGVIHVGDQQSPPVAPHKAHLCQHNRAPTPQGADRKQGKQG